MARNPEWFAVFKESMAPPEAKTPAEWNDSGSTFMPAGAPDSSGESDPDGKRRKAEMEHELSVNNQSTQQWFESILGPTLEFRDLLGAAIQTPGVAIHDPNHSKNVKPMERAAQKIDEMIAHITSHKSDTPGPGRGHSGITQGSLVNGKGDEPGDIEHGFGSRSQEMNKGIVDAFRQS